MPSEEKTFRVNCAICGKQFTVRFPVYDEAAEGTGEEVVVCLHCRKQVKIALPLPNMKPGELVRSRKVDP